MKIDGINVIADKDITYEEIEQIVAEEQKRWAPTGKTLGTVTLTIDGDEIIVKAVERSPIKRVRRITGYLSTEDRFNDSKHAELEARVAHV